MVSLFLLYLKIRKMVKRGGIKATNGKGIVYKRTKTLAKKRYAVYKIFHFFVFFKMVVLVVLEQLFGSTNCVVSTTHSR